MLKVSWEELLDEMSELPLVPQDIVNEEQTLLIFFDHGLLVKLDYAMLSLAQFLS